MKLILAAIAVAALGLTGCTATGEANKDGVGCHLGPNGEMVCTLPPILRPAPPVTPVPQLAK